jgi:integrase
MLFNAYLSSLENRGARSLRNMKNILACAQDALGAETLAAAVSPEAICAWLGQIYARGADSHSDRARAALKAVFNFGMKAKFDYRTSGVAWNLKSNPTDLIPVDRGASSRVRTRFLNRDELFRFHSDLTGNLDSPAARVLLFCLLTGCRIEESQIKIGMVDLGTGIIRWAKTKSGKPHQIAMGNRLWGLLKEWCENRSSEEFLFPSSREPQKPVSCDTIIKYFNRLGFKGATPRDACRRTVKTMGQVAGIDLSILDIIQNHASDRSVSTLNYNRYALTDDAAVVMRNALNKWENWIERLHQKEAA